MARMDRPTEVARSVAIPASGIAGLLGSWRDNEGPGPLYLRLAESIQKSIRGGELEVGARLPAERDLAEKLGLSRSTVTAAYELLRQRDSVVRRQGAGTYVSQVGASRTAGLPVPSAQSATLPEVVASAIEFTTAAPKGAEFVTDELIADALEEFRQVREGHGYSALGLPALRAAIAERLTETGLPTAPAEILVTTGAQQALYLSAQLLLRPGDVAVVEDPTWLGAIDAYRAARAKIVGTVSDRWGPRTSDLSDAAARGRVHVLHVSPTVNNPTGVLMSEERRREIVKVAEAQDTAIVEDNTLAELTFCPAPAPIGALTTGIPVLTVGSLSKIVWGGLRVGWVRAPEPLITRLGHMKLTVDRGSSLLGQAIALRLMRDLPVIRQQRLAAISEHLDVLTSELQTRLPSWSWDRPAGGLSLWVRLPQGNSTEFGQIARRHNVVVVPGAMSSPTGGMDAFIRLPFGGHPDSLREGVRRLESAWGAYAVHLDERHLAHFVG